MSNSQDFSDLKAAINSLYQRGVLPHTTNPNALKDIAISRTGTEGVGRTGAYYVSGLVQDVPYFIDPAASFVDTTPVLPGDILHTTIDEFPVDIPILGALSNVKITLAIPSPITPTHAQDAGYSIRRLYTDSPLDDIFALIDKIGADLGL